MTITNMTDTQIKLDPDTLKDIEKQVPLFMHSLLANLMNYRGALDIEFYCMEETIGHLNPIAFDEDESKWSEYNSLMSEALWGMIYSTLRITDEMREEIEQ